ncbi:phage head closure protein [Pasteurella bettyae]|uniref:Putative phage head-tail adaptor n=1 Tax=Pasteurella bettyae CCUG 2042 TaxID=1095749 RepID=I3DCK3_9PAST|nr:phage head closure protein [Pasteurella bettyae]EIJ69446.1 putative phage head-tail adaptor [Pasteurella bettyae CCUG 2042]SUB21413.1 Bacteriophage head-tail adaptor [Pasteurella bettyae]
MAVMIKAGKYNKVITIQRRNKEKEKARNYGETRKTEWEDVATVHASVEPIQGREYFSGPFQLGEDIIRIRIRYLPNINRRMRVKYGERLLEINAVIDSKEEHKELQLMCKENSLNAYF